MRWHHPLILCIVSLAASTARGDKPTQSPAVGKIDRLIVQLHSARFREREAASVELEAMGEPALEPLKKSAADSDPEVATRAIALVGRITARLETARRLKPTVVDLRLADVTAEAAVAELARQSGYTVTLTGGQSDASNRRVTLQTGRVPFWDALRKLCDAAELHEVQTSVRDQSHTAADTSFRARGFSSGVATPISRTIELAHGRAPAVPSHVEGALRFQAVTGAEAAGLPPARDDEWIVLLRVDAEPRLAVEGVFAVRVDRAVDGRGRPVAALPPPEPAALSDEEVMLMRRAAALRARGIAYHQANVSAYGPGVAPVRFQRFEARPADLREWVGAAGVTLRTGEEELVALEKPLEAPAGSVARGKDVRLSIPQLSKRDDGSFDLAVDVRHAWEVRPGSRGGVPMPTGRGVRFGQVVVQDVGSAADDTRPFYGLALVDADGRPVPMTGPRRIQLRAHGDGRLISYSVTVRPREGERGAPARLVFRGSRAISAEVPFTLSGVPLKGAVIAR